MTTRIVSVDALEHAERLSPRINVTLCGELQFELDGVRVDRLVRRRQSLELLGLLVLERGRWLRCGELVELLWPERPPGTKDGSLRVLLSDLRGALGDRLLRARPAVRLTLPKDACVDIEQAARLVADARAGLANRHYERAALDASRAFGLAKRQLLPLATGTWIERHRDEYDEIALGALECLAGASLQSGHVLDRGVWAARQLVARSPFRERGHELLMRTLAAEGNGAEALVAYERLRALLRDELGTVPSGRISEVHRSLLRAPALEVA
ncbi:MAG: AfsR/SARP family transcriptional regulator [Solirubrobacteraceae bacterium]